MKKVWIIAVFTALVLPHAFSQAAVHDPAWDTSFIAQMLNSFSQYHQMIQHYQATIQQIQQDYERFQFAIKQAQTWKFNNIDWEGGIDPTNSLVQMGSQVNSLLGSLARAKEAVAGQNISIDGQSYSLMDLLDVADVDGNGKNFFSAAKDSYGEAKSAFRKSAEGWKQGLTPLERSYIYSRYGLDAADYFIVKKTKSVVNDRLTKVIAATDTNLREVQEKKLSDLQLAYMNKIMEGENLNPAQIGQLQAAIASLSVRQLQDMSGVLKDYIAYQTYKDRRTDAEKEAASAAETSRKFEHNGADNFD